MGTETRALPVLGGPSASSLPPLYIPWVQDILSGSVPEERHATCDDCAMCEPNDNAITASRVAFDRAVKCCSYVPALPNFLVGGVLCDGEIGGPHGRASIEHRIAEGTGMTPLGLLPDPNYALVYKYAGPALFGRTQGLRCPHYISTEGRCGIWRHRNAICATYFCKFERGAAGKRFWNALLLLLTAVERHLALWCAEKLGETIGELGPALLPYYATALRDLRGRWSDRWAGRPTDFYREAAGLARPLSWSDVCAIGGPELGLLTYRLREAHEALLSEEIPEHVRLGAVTAMTRGHGAKALTGYSDYDMLVLPTSLVDTLAQFDGRRPTVEVAAEIAAVTGLPFDPPTVRQLVDFGILVPMPEIESTEIELVPGTAFAPVNTTRPGDEYVDT